MRVIPNTGTKIWANVAYPGMIVQTETGERVEVQRVTQGYDTITLDNGYGSEATVPGTMAPRRGAWGPLSCHGAMVASTTGHGGHGRARMATGQLTW